MVFFEHIMITITIFLFFTNAVFMFSSVLPGSENGDGTLLNLGLSSTDVNDMNNQLNQIINASNVFKPENIDINASVTVTGEEKDYLLLFQKWLFGGLDTATLGLASKVVGTMSILKAIISLVGATFFGYLFWIDFFINPLWGVGFAAIGLGIKAFFFFVQAMWLFDIISRIFFAGTGSRG